MIFGLWFGDYVCVFLGFCLCFSFLREREPKFGVDREVGKYGRNWGVEKT